MQVYIFVSVIYKSIHLNDITGIVVLWFLVTTKYDSAVVNL